MVRGSNGAHFANKQRKRARITDEGWGATGEAAHHKGFSTPVANRSEHAQRHDLKKGMDSLGSRIDASRTRGVSELLCDSAMRARQKAHENRIAFICVHLLPIAENLP